MGEHKRKEPRPTECRRCHARPLYWERFHRRYQLVTGSGQIHICADRNPRDPSITSYLQRVPAHGRAFTKAAARRAREASG